VKIFILGTGRMGAWLVEEFCHQHQVAVYDRDLNKLKCFDNVERFSDLNEVTSFQPELAINAVSPQNTVSAFEELLPLIPANCMLSDIASVKAGVAEFYRKIGRRFVSSHPMFGPTFANIRDLRHENAIIISESDPAGKAFFPSFFRELATEYFRIHLRRTRSDHGLFFRHTLCFDVDLRSQFENAESARYYLPQTS